MLVHPINVEGSMAKKKGSKTKKGKKQSKKKPSIGM
jgi:hypothetical protein